MRLAWAFFKRDATIAFSYRVSFVVQFIGKLAVLALFFFLSKTVGDKPLPILARYGGDFLAFMIIGISLSDCVLVSLTSFATQIRDAQTTGTLEATLMSPVHLPTILLYSVLWDYFMTAIGFVFYLVGGVLLFGLKIHQFHFFAALLLFILTITSFMGVGILWAGIVL
ncbi:MAG: ABC transporter permease, partial [Bryobacteraceae bacterium]